MRLRRFALVLAGGAAAGLIALGSFATQTWITLQRNLEQEQRISAAHERAVRLSNAIDYAVLMRHDPGILSAIEEDARTLQTQLTAIDAPVAQEATTHLEEIAYMAGVLGADGAAGAPASFSLASPIRVHQSALVATLERLRAETDAALIGMLYRSLAVALVGAGGFGALCVLGFFGIQRRLHRPLKTLDATITALAAGHANARADARTHDELGDLARHVNTMADELQRHERKLHDRMKELNCLYEVLALTNDEDISEDEVHSQTVESLPTGFVHSNDAVARISLREASYTSARWHEPWSRLSAEIRLGDTAAGFVEVGYLSPHADAPRGEGPFVPEERALLDGVAAHLGRMLSNRQLALRLHQAQRLEAVGQLTDGIAHDFNNLLTVITGNASLLREELDGDAEHMESIDMILNAGDRGAELTRHLLAFARRQPLLPHALDLNALVPDMMTMLERTLGEHIDIEFRGDDALWPCLADQAQLENALLNLTLNARDAMPDGGRLTIETRNAHSSDAYATDHTELEPGDYVMLAVSDTGTGMSSDVLAQVFEPFYTTKDTGEGTGLGLSMIYGFAKQSNGHVNIYSEPDEGTTVTIYLPRAQTGEADAVGR